MGEVQSAEGHYCNLVQVENGAVDTAQDAKRKGLDALQMNEEERIIFMLLSLDRFIQIGRDAFHSMSFDLDVNPLNVDEGNHKVM